MRVYFNASLNSDEHVVFRLKLHFTRTKSATKFLCVNTVIDKVVRHYSLAYLFRAKMVCVGRPLLRENSAETDQSPSKTPIFQSILFCVISPNLIALQADYVTEVDVACIQNIVSQLHLAETDQRCTRTVSLSFLLHRAQNVCLQCERKRVDALATRQQVFNLSNVINRMCSERLPTAWNSYHIYQFLPVMGSN